MLSILKSSHFPPLYSAFSAWHVWISRFLAPFLSSFFPPLPTCSSSPFCSHFCSSALSPSLPFPRPSHNTLCLPNMRPTNGKRSFFFQFLTLRLLNISLHILRGVKGVRNQSFRPLYGILFMTSFNQLQTLI